MAYHAPNSSLAITPLSHRGSFQTRVRVGESVGPTDHMYRQLRAGEKSSSLGRASPSFHESGFLIVAAFASFSIHVCSLKCGNEILLPSLGMTKSMKMVLVVVINDRLIVNVVERRTKKGAGAAIALSHTSSKLTTLAAMPSTSSFSFRELPSSKQSLKGFLM